ncbi:hypothetical protein A2U01_0115030, partial [Trifolium medium]|nr:hypothetical protein [Trifolium medium]
PPGNPPRPAELDAIIHEEVEAEGQRTTTLVANMLDIRQLIQALMARSRGIHISFTIIGVEWVEG